MAENDENRKNGNENEQKSPSRLRFDKPNLRRAFTFPL